MNEPRGEIGDVMVMTADGWKLAPPPPVDPCTMVGCSRPIYGGGTLCVIHRRPPHRPVSQPISFEAYQAGRDRVRRSNRIWREQDSDRVDSMMLALMNRRVVAPPLIVSGPMTQVQQPSPALRKILDRVDAGYQRPDTADAGIRRVRERIVADRDRAIHKRINRMLNHSSQALRLVAAGHPQALINAAKAAADNERALLLHELGFTDADPS